MQGRKPTMSKGGYLRRPRPGGKNSKQEPTAIRFRGVAIDSSSRGKLGAVKTRVVFLKIKMPLIRNEERNKAKKDFVLLLPEK